MAREAASLGLALPSGNGPVEDSRGTRLGSHSGHFRFTIGQRRGIGVAGSERLYVLALDAPSNRVVVGPASDLQTREAWIRDLRMMADPEREVFRAEAKTRHRAAEVGATVFRKGDGGARIEFDRPVRAAAPGQSCVFYDGDAVLGGGVFRVRPPTAPSSV